MSQSLINPRSVTVATTSTRLLGPNPHRRAILFCPPNTNRYTASWEETAILDQGINMHATRFNLLLTREDIGSAITLPLSAISATASQVVTVYEWTDAP